MANLKTKYMGYELKNPVIIGASNLVTDLDNLHKLEDAGAAAVVYKSLFEEQVQLESAQLEDDLNEYTDRHAEMTSLFPNIEHAGAKEYLFNLKKAREVLSIPFFASLNAINKESWVEYAKRIEETGVDGLELNFYNVPKNAETTGEAIEKQQIEILREVKKSVNIPVGVKISASYSNPVHFITALSKAGADGVVLFNRFYQPDIDIKQLKHASEHNLSTPFENRLPMRFAGLLYGTLSSGICANSGIHDGADVAKMLLAGADAVQIVSTLYKNKVGHVSKIIADLTNWMETHGFNSIDDFKGNLSKKKINDPFVYKRAQYIDLILNSEELLKRAVLR